MYGDMPYCHASHINVNTTEQFGALVCKQIKQHSCILMHECYVRRGLRR